MIKGLTDAVRISWDGKIRGGYKENEAAAPTNTPYFLLHDAPGLDSTLGKDPTEFFATVLYDDPEAIMKMDLEWYKTNQLVCQGNGEVAAFFELGDHPGVMQQQAVFKERDFLGRESVRAIPRSRQRICAYKQCPEFVQGKCRQHLRFVLAIPEHSMASLYTMDSVSSYTQNSLLASREKAMRHNAILQKPYKISGEIFRVYKSKEDVSFLNPKTGKMAERENNVTLIDWVPFEKYAEAFKSKIRDEDWAFLMAIRQAGLRFPGQEFAPEITGVMQLSAPTPQPAIAYNPLTASEDERQAEEVALKERANHKSVLPLFEQIASMKKNVLNTEENRMKTARQFADVAQLADYLKKAIQNIKKETPSVEQKKAAPVEQAVQNQPTNPQSAGNLFN